MSYGWLAVVLPGLLTVATPAAVRSDGGAVVTAAPAAPEIGMTVAQIERILGNNSVQYIYSGAEQTTYSATYIRTRYVYVVVYNLAHDGKDRAVSVHRLSIE